MLLSRSFSTTNPNPALARAGIAFIFLFSLLYAVFFNSTLYTIAAETFPTHLRGYGTSVAALCQVYPSSYENSSPTPLNITHYQIPKNDLDLDLDLDSLLTRDIGSNRHLARPNHAHALRALALEILSLFHRELDRISGAICVVFEGDEGCELGGCGGGVG